MDLVSALTQEEFLALSVMFKDGLQRHEFFSVMAKAITPFVEQGRLPANTRWLSQGELSRVHMEMDIAGKGCVTWSDFTSSLVDTSACIDVPAEGTSGYLRHTFLTNMRFPNQSEEIRKVLFLSHEKMKRYVAYGTNSNLSVHEEKNFACVASVKLKGPMLDTCYVSRSHMLVVSTLDQSVIFFDIGNPDQRQGNGPPTTNRASDDHAEDGDANKLIVRRIIMFEKTQTKVFYDEKAHIVYSSDRMGNVSLLNVDQVRNCPIEQRIVPIQAMYIILNQLRWHSASLTSIMSIENVIASCSMDNTIRLHDRERPWVETRAYIDAHKSVVRGLCHNKEYDLLVSVGDDPSPTCWVVSLPRTSFTFRDDHDPHKKPIIGVHSLKNSPYLLTADSEATFKVWDIRTYRCTQNITYPSHASGGPSMENFTVSESSNKFVGAGRRLVVLEYAAKELRVSAHTGIVRGIVYSHGSIVTYSNEDVKTWSYVTGTMLRCIKPKLDVGEEISAFCLDDTGHRFFIGTSFGNVQCLMLYTGNLQNTFRKQQHEITHVSYLPCVGSRKVKVVVTSDATCRAYSWNEDDGKLISDHCAGMNLQDVAEIDIVQNVLSRKMIIGRDDRNIHVVDVSLVTAPLVESVHHGIAVVGMMPMDDMHILALLDTHGGVHFWNMNGGLAPYCSLPEEENHHVCKIVYTNCRGQRLFFSGDMTGTITVWDLWNVEPPTVPQVFWKLHTFSVGHAPVAGIRLLPAGDETPVDLIAVRFASECNVEIYTIYGAKCGTLSESRLPLNHPSARIENALLATYKVPLKDVSPPKSRRTSFGSQLDVASMATSVVYQPNRRRNQLDPTTLAGLVTHQTVLSDKDKLTGEAYEKRRRKKLRHKNKISRLERKSKAEEMWKEHIPPYLKDMIVKQTTAQVSTSCLVLPDIHETSQLKEVGESHMFASPWKRQESSHMERSDVTNFQTPMDEGLPGIRTAHFTVTSPPLLSPRLPAVPDRARGMRPRHTVTLVKNIPGVIKK